MVVMTDIIAIINMNISMMKLLSKEIFVQSF